MTLPDRAKAALAEWSPTMYPAEWSARHIATIREALELAATSNGQSDKIGESPADQARKQSDLPAHPPGDLVRREDVLRLIDLKVTPWDSWAVMRSFIVALPAATPERGQGELVREHTPGCPALGGYGHGKEPCECGAAPPAPAAAESEAIELLEWALPYVERIRDAERIRAYLGRIKPPAPSAPAPTSPADPHTRPARR